MDALLTVAGQTGLPRYFPQVFAKLTALSQGQLDFILPDQRRFRVQGQKPGPIAEIHIHSDEVFARLIREGELGFCDAYLDGDWSTPDLQAALDLFTLRGNLQVTGSFMGRRILQLYESLRFALHSNSPKQARKNIAAHYDLGNEFYRLWLDPSMTYSSALFHSGQESLELAQKQKYASLVDQMGAKPGDHILEIGCGWGGFAEYAARERGLRVTGLTISQAQYDFAQARMARAGLNDRVTLKLQDYRDERGQYDGIASIEMFEAVGEKYWPVYFKQVFSSLKPGGNATLQIITIAEERFPLYRASVDFIQKYIFPGGMLPPPSALRAEAQRAGLGVRGSIEFGQSYSQTLRRWRESFHSHWSEARKLGFDERFRRMWDFYLASCAGAFKGGNCDVTQITLNRPAM